VVDYYSHVFDYVEIDSTFYRTPSLQMVKNWDIKTPKNFKFTAKFPKAITHDKRLVNVDKELQRFLMSWHLWRIKYWHSWYNYHLLCKSTRVWSISENFKRQDVKQRSLS